MKIRWFIVLAMLSFLLCVAMREARTTRASFIGLNQDQISLKNWLRARIAVQIEKGRDVVDLRQVSNGKLIGPIARFPAHPETESKFNRGQIFSSAQDQNEPLTNIRINDPAQEVGSRVQNGTSSAVSG